jgi:hypothetical protein
MGHSFIFLEGQMDGRISVFATCRGSTKTPRIQSAGEKAMEKTEASLLWKTLRVFHFSTASAAASSGPFFTVVYETPIGRD